MLVQCEQLEDQDGTLKSGGPGSQSAETGVVPSTQDFQYSDWENPGKPSGLITPTGSLDQRFTQSPINIC